MFEGFSPPRVGAQFDRRTGLCAWSPTPEQGVQMCADPAMWHIFVTSPDGLVSLLTCATHEPVAYMVGDALVCEHRVDWMCRTPGARLWLAPATSYCTTAHDPTHHPRGNR